MSPTNELQDAIAQSRLTLYRIAKTLVYPMPRYIGSPAESAA